MWRERCALTYLESALRAQKRGLKIMVAFKVHRLDQGLWTFRDLECHVDLGLLIYDLRIDGDFLESLVVVSRLQLVDTLA